MASSSQFSIDNLVMQYLKMRGMEEAAELVESSLTSSLGSAGGGGAYLEPATMPLSIGEDIVIDGLYQGSCCIYSSAYELFCDWACNSLETVRDELIVFCFPLFTHL